MINWMEKHQCTSNIALTLFCIAWEEVNRHEKDENTKKTQKTKSSNIKYHFLSTPNHRNLKDTREEETQGRLIAKK